MVLISEKVDRIWKIIKNKRDITCGKGVNSPRKPNYSESILTRVSRYMRQKLTKLQGEIEKFTIILAVFNKTWSQKRENQKDTDDLNSAINLI